MKKNLRIFILAILFGQVAEHTIAQCAPVIQADLEIICSDSAAHITVTNPTSTPYQWYKNDILIPDSTRPALRVREAGSYKVTYAGCGSFSNSITITVHPTPLGSIHCSPVTPTCTGTEVQLEIVPNEPSSNIVCLWSNPPEIIGRSNPFIETFYSNTLILGVIQNISTGCAKSVTYFLVVNPTIDGGTLSPDQTICSGETPATITGTPPSGGNGTYTYQWQKSTTGPSGPWITISGATGSSYLPGALTQTTWFRRIAISPPCPAVSSNSVQITVNLIPTVTSAVTKSICSGSSVAYTITSNVPNTTFNWTGVTTSPAVTVFGVTAAGNGPINDILTIDPGGSASGEVTYTITPTGPAPTYCVGTPKSLVVTVKPLPVPVITGPTPVCFGNTGLTYSTAAGKSDYVWSIQGGVITGGQNTNSITVNWTTTGAQWVKVSYSENGCPAASPTQYNVTVNPLPVPVITGPNPACAGSTGNVYSTAGGMTNYTWTISGGGVITGGGGSGDNTVTVTWNTSGVQWIRVTYTDANGCRNTSPTQFNVNVSVPSLTGPTSPCLGSTNSVYSTDVGMTNYQWSVSPGGTITSGGSTSSSTATVTWNAAGAQTVTVNYTSGAGCMASTPTTLNINVNPLPTPTLSGNNDVCAGTTGVIYTTQTGKSLYTWTISSGGTITGGGTLISNTATVTWNNAGSQWIKVNYTDANGCTAVLPTQFDVTVKPLPVPGISGSVSECAGTTGVTYITEPGKSNYNWTITGGNITSGLNTNTVTVTWTTPGTRWIAVNYTDLNGCSATSSTQYAVTVKPLPVPTVAGASSVCIHAANVAYTTESGMSNYLWSVSGGGTITGGGGTSDNSVYVTWNTVGPQTVSVNYTGINSCMGSSATVYNVAVNPLPTPTLSGPNEACANSTGNIYTTQPGMSNYSWSVSAGGTITSGGTSSSNTATVTWNTPGANNISINYSQTGCPAVAPTTYNVTVNPLPTSDAGFDQLIPYGTSTTLIGTAGGGTPGLNYEWTPETGINGPNNTLTVLTENIMVSPTDFTLTVTDSKGCTAADVMRVTLNGTALAVLATAVPQVICNNGTTVQLNATATGGNSPTFTSYEWTSTPVGFTSSIQNPVVNPSQTTTYHCTVYDNFNYASGSVTVTVNPLPTIFNVTGGGEYCSGGAGLPVELNGSQSGVNYQLYLDGGTDGSPLPGTGSALSFGYKTSPGVYTIRATNGTTTCQREMAGSVVITMNPLPTAYAGADQIIPHGTSTSLTGAASGGTSPLFYLWTPLTMIKTGETTLAPTTENIYATQTFTLTVTDNKGCTQDDQMQVIINGSALSVVAYVNNSTICNGSPAQLSAIGSGGSGIYTYTWNCIPPGTIPWSSTQQNPVVTPSETTLYTVTIHDGYNDASASVTVIVNPLPPAYTVSGGGSYCSGGTGMEILLSGSDVGVDYQLYRNITIPLITIPGTGSSISFGNHSAEGSYTVKATRISTGCEKMMTGAVTVTILPLPNAYSMTGGGSYPSGGQGMIVGLTNSQTGINYRLIHNADTLTSSPGIPGTDSPINFGYQTLAGNYTAVGKNAVTGCVREMLGSVSVTINPYPSLFDVFGGGTLCLGEPGKMIGLNGSEIGIRYVLQRDGDSIAGYPASGDTLFLGIYTTAGVYTVKGVNIATGLSRIMNGSAIIIVNPLPVSYLIVPQGDTCPGTEILINGSQSGVLYYLITGTDTVAQQAGTGTVGLLSFGNQYTPGAYRVVGINIITGCKAEMTGTITIQPSPTVFDLNPPGILCPGQTLTLSGSEIGINYQLRRDSLTNVGPEIPGTGSLLNFGAHFLPGVYRIIATNPLSHCYSWQAGRATIQPGPDIYSILPNGDTCSGGTIRLNGSQIGIYYHLVLNGTVFLDSLYGTGQPLVFGTYQTSGTYAVLAVDTLTHCESWMDGFLNFFSSPIVYHIVPNGLSCAGSVIGLDDSELGVDYTLIRNGSIIAGGPLPGTGSPLSFGIQNTEGNYTIKAINTTTGCSNNMTGTTMLYPRPVSFSLQPQGQQCAGTDIYLNGSQNGVNYELRKDNIVQMTLPGTGSIIHFGFQSLPGVYTINAVNVLTTCDTLMTGSATIVPLPVAFDITPAGENCSPTTIGLSGSQIGVAYQLIKNSAPSGTPQVGTGNALNFGSQTEGAYRIVANDLTTNCRDTMPGTIIITPGPTVIAGNDTTICTTHTLNLNGHAYDYTSVQWFTSGDGSFSDVTILNPVYTPGMNDITIGSVNLAILVHGSAACLSRIDTDTLILTILPYPIANAGSNDTICASQSYVLNGAAQFYSSVHWTSSGDGNFNNPNILNSIYTPGILDKSTGSATLTLSVQGDLQCSSDSVIDQMTLTIEPLPIADAGSDYAICENMTIHLSGTAQHYSSVLWSSTGDGDFDDPTFLTATYTPGILDKQTGSARLILMAYGKDHCDGTVRRDTMNLQIQGLPIVNAGADDTICANQTASLHGTAQFHSGVQWSTSGDGSFSLVNELNTIYTPGSNDKTNGTVILRLTAAGIQTCLTQNRKDSLTLTLIALPVADAGNDTLTCPNIAIPLHGTGQNYMSVLWTTQGDGVFDNSTVLTPHYTPGANDATLGHVLLMMTLNGQTQCESQISTDTIRIDFKPLPSVSITGTPSMCEGNSGNLVFNFTGSAPWTITYSDGLNSFTVQNIPASPFTVIVSPAVTTTYTLTSVEDANCYGFPGITSPFTIHVYPKPLSFQMTSTNNGGYCEGGNGIEIGIEGSQTGIFYRLLFGGQPVGNAMPGTGNPVSFGWHTTPGIYKILAFYPTTLCETLFTDSVRVIIFSNPLVDFSPDSTCFGQPTYFHLSGTDIDKISEWNWNFGDGVTITYTSPIEPTHLYPAYGNYQAVLSVIDTNGCTKTQIHNVHISPLPTVLYSHSAPACAGNIVTFTDYSYTSGTTYLIKWHWEFGDGEDTTIFWPGNQNIVHNYLLPTTYQTRLTVTNNENCSASLVRTIDIIPAPVAYFENSNPCMNSNIQFNDFSQSNGGGTITEWHWNFGDPTSGISNTSILKNPVHNYQSAGYYEVKLVVMTSNGCLDTIKKQVLVKMQPRAMFAADLTCFGNATVFTDQSLANADSMISWNWDFGDGSVHATVQNPVHTFPWTGLFNVTLTVTNSNSCTHDTTLTVNVISLPVAAYQSDGPKCVGSQVHYTNFSTTQHGQIVKWKWEFGDGTDTTIFYPGVPNVSHVFLGNMTQHNVRLTVTTSDSCISFVNHLIISLPSPTANFAFPETLCKSAPIQFTDQSVENGGAAILSWYWDFDDPLSGTSNVSYQQSPTHIFTTARSYRVFLMTTNINNCFDTISKTVIINELPTADFSADTACSGVETHFADLSAANGGIITSWDWNFGDGTPHSHQQNPSHLFTGAGTYPVTLVVTNTSGCTHVIVKQIKVNPLPVASFSNSITNCAGSPVQFNDLSYPSQGYLVQWTWNFDDGSDTTILFPGIQNVTHVYSMGGIYNVTLTVKNSDGCSGSISHLVTVGVSPIANFSYSDILCAGSFVQFDDLSQAYGGVQIITWFWNFGDPTSGVNNTSSLQEPSHTYQNPGDYQVKLMVTNANNCTDTISHPISVSDQPTVHFSADTVCKGDTTHFIDASIPNYGTLISWLWNFGDGITSAEQNPDHLYANSGIYDVTLTVTNSMQCQHDTTQRVLVKIPPVALFTYANGCMNSPVEFLDQSSTQEGQVNSWHWDFGDGDTSNVQNPIHIFVNSGTYYVTLTIGTTIGCQDSFTVPVVVYIRPTADFSSYSTYCPTGQVTFTDHSTGSGVPIIGWYWIFENGFSSTVANPTYTFSVTDTIYPVTLIVTDANGCTDTLLDDVFVVAGFNFTFISDSVCVGNLTHFQPINLAPGDTLHDIKWNFGDPNSGTLNTSTLYYPTHLYTNPETYIVKLRAFNSNQCVDSVYREVIVHPGPIANFSYDTIAYCDQLVRFYNQSEGNGASVDSLKWQFGDGSSEIQIPPIPPVTQHQYAGFGTYEVILTAINANGCQNSIRKSVLVACVASTFTASDTLPCANQSVQLIDSSGPINLINNWYWDFGDGQDTSYTQYIQGFSHTYTTPGEFEITLIVTAVYNDISISDTSKRFFIVKTSPTAAFINAPVCFGDTSRFINISDSNGVSIISNQWKFGDGTAGANDTSSLLNPVYHYPNPGKYNVRLVVSNSLNCRDTLIQKSMVYKLPEADFVSLKACSRDYVLFTDQTIPGDTTISYWLWTFGDLQRPYDSLTIANPVYTYGLSGFYEINLKTKDINGCWDTITKFIEVLESPISSFTMTENVDGMTGKIKLKNLSTNATSYFWNFGNGSTSKEENPTVTYQDDGTYKIMLITWNDYECSDTTQVDYEFMFHNLFVPNAFSPTNILYSVRLFKPVGINLRLYDVKVFDVQGHLIWESNSLDDQGKPVEGWDGTFNGTLMPQGNYMWKIDAVFKDGKNWEGSDIGVGTPSTMGIVTLIR